tara:strand:- start:198 stop:404 length:207 start_codon:yes stop_codon:yes gene_type:complete
VSDYSDWKARAAERKKTRDAERKSSADLAKKGKKLKDDPDYMRKYRQKQKDSGIMGKTKPGGKWDKLS